MLAVWFIFHSSIVLRNSAWTAHRLFQGRARVQSFFLLVPLLSDLSGEGDQRRKRIKLLQSSSFSRTLCGLGYLLASLLVFELLCRGSRYISHIVCGAFWQSPVMSVCTVWQAGIGAGIWRAGPLPLPIPVLPSDPAPIGQKTCIIKHSSVLWFQWKPIHVQTPGEKFVFLRKLFCNLGM